MGWNESGNEKGSGKENTKFWFDLWVRDTLLSECFGRLFRLSEKKNIKVSEMGHWWGVRVGSGI